jgi:hypothetical protein
VTITADRVAAAIDNGDFDAADLRRIVKLAGARLRSLETEKAHRFQLGDAVQIGPTCGTLYLRGCTGRIVGLKQKNVVVLFDGAAGRFTGKRTTCPPGMLIPVGS